MAGLFPTDAVPYWDASPDRRVFYKARDVYSLTANHTSKTRNSSDEASCELQKKEHRALLYITAKKATMAFTDVQGIHTHEDGIQHSVAA